MGLDYGWIMGLDYGAGLWRTTGLNCGAVYLSSVFTSTVYSASLLELAILLAYINSRDIIASVVFSLIYSSEF